MFAKVYILSWCFSFLDELFKMTNGFMEDYRFKVLEREDNLFASRVNFLLVAESMLFISFVTAKAYIGNNSDLELDSLIINLLGIGITILLGFVNIRHNYYIFHVRKEIDTDNIFTEYKDAKERWQKLPHWPTNPILSWYLTWIFLSVWLSFLNLTLGFLFFVFFLPIAILIDCKLV